MSKVEDLQKKRLESLARDPSNVVMQWEYDEPQDTCSARYAMTLARDVCKERLSLSSETDDDKVRRILTERTEAYRKFAASHPRIFQAATDLRRGAVNIEIIKKFARLHARVEGQGDVKASDPQVQSLVFQEVVDATLSYGPPVASDAS